MYHACLSAKGFILCCIVEEMEGNQCVARLPYLQNTLNFLCLEKEGEEEDEGRETRVTGMVLQLVVHCPLNITQISIHCTQLHVMSSIQAYETMYI